MKCLGINLTKYVQEQYEENYKIGTKIEELNKWRENQCSWIGILIIVKMSVLPKLTCRFNVITLKALKHQTGQTYLKCLHAVFIE